MIVDSLRVLVLAPRGRDAELIATILARDANAVVCCDSPGQLLAALEAGAGCAVIAQEAITRVVELELVRSIAAQQPWSDFPLIVLTGLAGTSPPRLDGNMTMLERPITPQTLIAAVQSALRTRRRQYQARAAIQQRDQFLAMLGHELRNPLGAIVMATDLLVIEDDPTALRRRLAILARQANHLSRLVDDLLEVARVTTGKIRLKREPVAIDDLVLSTIDMHAESAHCRGITLNVTQASGAIVDGDPVRLVQVLDNLVGNAIKYSPSGRGVELGTAIVGDSCEISVRDHGIGIEPDVIPHVFELFVQAEPGIERADGGMGIGLTMVDRLVQLHGGTVEAHSAGAEHGSTFVVRIPLGDPAVKRITSETEVVHTMPVRAVIVEDSEDLRDLSCEMLEHFGCTVDSAATGPDGLELILRVEPEVAIVDIGLPGMDGLELARTLRTRCPDLHTVLVAVTGYGRLEDHEAAIAAGFDLHFAKPIDADRLEQLVDRIRAQRAA